MNHQAVSIYLNDHLAGATSGVELARRIAGAHRSSGRAGELRRLADDIAEDRESLLELMDALDVTPRRYKVYGGWVAEKVGRLKPNGRVYHRSGLSTLIELEALRMGIQGKHQLWQALLPVVMEHDGFDEERLQTLLERAADQMASVDALHDTAADSILRGGRD
ncbi:hypothetical protein [Streptomyces purpureus]|uniref:Uncharacterized protein n=1 Tax=Streptomyces purpureus TaxID=1951 RepID=A0A918HAJ2_9ACTN|nr:hypothetical protein [Streptomyces purpureus]GGT46069.1 hypothetical protein GCM10014713_44990 [Streptomyces purpureus]